VPEDGGAHRDLRAEADAGDEDAQLTARLPPPSALALDRTPGELIRPAAAGEALRAAPRSCMDTELHPRPGCNDTDVLGCSALEAKQLLVVGAPARAAAL
jgi:hypothetical protein